MKYFGLFNLFALLTLGLAHSFDGAKKRNAAELTPTWLLDADYPGGNIKLQKVEGDKVFLEPDLRDSSDWFYWSFRVTKAAGKTLTFQFPAYKIGLLGPAVSVDERKSWNWLYQESSRNRTAFTYKFTSDAPVYFCLAFGYTHEHLKRFVLRFQDNPHWSTSELAVSRKGRSVPLFKVGNLSGRAKHRLFISSRHHACEMMASYVLEGMILQALESTKPWAKWLRKNVEITIVPFVDYDGVEYGDQGKGRKPRDHNRDYGDGTIYPEVAAIKRLVGAWPMDESCMSIDIHCPWIYGGKYNENIYIVGSRHERIQIQQDIFSKVLESNASGLPYRAENNIHFGKDWNTVENYGENVSCSEWFARLSQTVVAVTVEIPYSMASGKIVSEETARNFGGNLIESAALYLMQKK